MAKQQGGDLFIVDNSDTDWKVSAYLAEKDLTNEHLKPRQAPPGVAPVLKCWMERN